MAGFGVLSLMMRSAPPPLLIVAAVVGFYLLYPVIMRAARPKPRPGPITPELKRLLAEAPPRKRKPDAR